ncbi:MAG: NUDIX hydrolase [Clostridia bacterium]|nr:NUDIX hydrolase [Clostridia bacterium]
MNDRELAWELAGEKKLLHTAVFDVYTQHERAANGLEGDYISLEAPDCVVVIPRTEKGFLLVRQWRHGASRITVEFPGGVIGRGEDPAEAALRELYEETGFRAGRITELGCVSPNPALFRSSFRVYLAEELEDLGTPEPDPDEFIEIMLLPEEEVIASFGNPEMSHAFMGAALALYMRERLINNKEKPCESI